ncbi:hypothetical protein Tco_0634703 [Tanacetum coccineum]
MEKKFVTNRDFQGIKENVDKVIQEINPQIALNATNDIIEVNLPRVITDTIIKEMDTFLATVPALISKEFVDHAPTIIEELFKNHINNNAITVHPTRSTSNVTTFSDLQHQMYLKMKRNLQDQVDDPELTDAFRKHDHDDYQEDDAPLEGEKRAKRRKTLKGDVDEVIPEDENPELIEEFRSVDKHVLTMYNHERMKATLRDMMSNQFRDAEEYAYHWEQTMNYIENQRVVRVTTEQQHGLDFMEHIIMMKENDKPDSFSEADFKYLNKNDIEDLYYLCPNKKVNYRENKLLNSLMTVNLTALTLIFPGIKACDPYSIVDKPSTCLIYLNSKNEKRVMYLVEIVKFCDATLERVLNEVKMKIFETEFLKKAPLLGDLNLDIMKAYEREITKCLRH